MPQTINGVNTTVQMLAQLKIYLSEETIDHARTVYSFLDLFGDFGGLLEVLSLTAAFFIVPLADFSLLVVSL
jgi:hypothetical protein